jgi:hypothetical protein
LFFCIFCFLLSQCLYFFPGTIKVSAVLSLRFIIPWQGFLPVFFSGGDKPAFAKAWAGKKNPPVETGGNN